MADSLPLNLRRLIYFHHKSAREFAQTLGTTERTVSAWLNDEREPSYKMAMTIAKAYGVGPELLEGDPLKFAKSLADPERIEQAEDEGIPKAKRGGFKTIATPPERVSPSG